MPDSSPAWGMHMTTAYEMWSVMTADEMWKMMTPFQIMDMLTTYAVTSMISTKAQVHIMTMHAVTSCADLELEWDEQVTLNEAVHSLIFGRHLDLGWIPQRHALQTCNLPDTLNRDPAKGTYHNSRRCKWV